MLRWKDSPSRLSIFVAKGIAQLLAVAPGAVCCAKRLCCLNLEIDCQAQIYAVSVRDPSHHHVLGEYLASACWEVTPSGSSRQHGPGAECGILRDVPQERPYEVFAARLAPQATQLRAGGGVEGRWEKGGGMTTCIKLQRAPPLHHPPPVRCFAAKLDSGGRSMKRHFLRNIPWNFASSVSRNNVVEGAARGALPAGAVEVLYQNAV